MQTQPPDVKAEAPEVEGKVEETARVEETIEPEVEVEEIGDTELVPYIEGHAQLIRNQRVMLDRDLARVYGVETKRLNQQRERNPTKFPGDFAFQLLDAEFDNLKLQNETSSSHGGVRHNPWVYTLEGCNMAATVLNTPKAVKRSVTIIRTFSDLERMAHGEEPKQPGFAEAIEEIVNRVSAKFEKPTLSKFDFVKERQKLLEGHFSLFGEPAPIVKETLEQTMLTEIMGDEFAPTLREKDLWYAADFWREKKAEGYLNKFYSTDDRLVNVLGRYTSARCKYLGYSVTRQNQLLGNNRIVEVGIYPKSILEYAFVRLIKEGKVAHQKIMQLTDADAAS